MGFRYVQAAMQCQGRTVADAWWCAAKHVGLTLWANAGVSYLLCSSQQLLANSLSPRLRRNCQVADVGDALRLLIGDEGAFLNSLHWQMLALRVNDHRP